MLDDDASLSKKERAILHQLIQIHRLRLQKLERNLYQQKLNVNEYEHVLCQTGEEIKKLRLLQGTQAKEFTTHYKGQKVSSAQLQSAIEKEYTTSDKYRELIARKNKLQDYLDHLQLQAEETKYCKMRFFRKIFKLEYIFKSLCD